SILPGHGGILDRFDSLSFVFPVLYALLSLFA
ncbi:MAG: phosphatidate cytidylyltransferase, partial [Limnochordia bacterium]